MRTYRFLILDVFTDRPFSGNQLAVFTNAVGLSDDEMLLLAQEIGFSETTFVLPSAGEGDFRCRIFTPRRELPFAGHPVLGTAFAVAGPLQSSLLRIETGRGVVPVQLEREGAQLVFGRMQQPLPTIEPCENVDELLEALGLSASATPVELYDNGSRHLYVRASDFDQVADLQPDLPRLEAAAKPFDAGVNVFAVEGHHAKTRMFWTDLGVGEDAATGSAAGPLAVHLARHGLVEWGQEITIAQGAEIGRPSTLYATALGSNEGVEAVEVGGSAVVVAKGEYGF